MSQNYEKLKNLLLELFQLNRPDLDFGLYRVMHARSVEVTQFLDEDLLPQVEEAFVLYKSADRAELEKELAKVIRGIEAAELNPDDSSKVKELRAQLADASMDTAALEGEVYDHLYTFFRRYYSEGDFVAKRVYKPGVYSIPYEGEEVTLHWANKEQYYIKTDEYLRDYTFRLNPDDETNPMRVHFHLAEAAEGEQGNAKAPEGKDRVFILAAAGDSSHDFMVEENGEQGKELVIRFEYRPATVTDWPDEAHGKTKPPAQKELNAFAVQRALAVSDASLAGWIEELGKPHVTSSGETADYTRLEAHVRRFTARNTFDYFIHRDLAGFLRSELDFFIKNEVMHLDDVENDSGPRVEQYLSKIKVIRLIATKVIDFLAQLEGFQKRLWLKKMFVVETSYCMPLSHIPDDFYSEICASDGQREEWVRLLAIDRLSDSSSGPVYSVPLTFEFLKAHPTLVMDCRHFPQAFTSRLIETIGDLDARITGTLINSDNFQALNLLQNREREEVNFIYIDPPYNADATEIVYKNGYRHSSWLALIASRLSLGRALLRDDGVHCMTIDDYEHAKARLLCDAEFGVENYLATVLIRNNPSGRSTVRGFSINHEFALFYGAGTVASVGRLPHSEQQRSRYDQADEIGSFEWENFRKSAAGSDRASRPKQHFPVYVNPETLAIRVPELDWRDRAGAYDVSDEPVESEVVVWPLDEAGTEKVWRWGWGRTKADLDSLEARHVDDRIELYGKKYLNESGLLPRTWWDKPEYSARDNGTRVLRDMFGSEVGFEFPKAVEAVKDSIRVGCPQSDGHVLDYFGGSATTGHAVIELNRETHAKRRFTLVEAGVHFETVLLARLKKVTYTPQWRDGKPARMATSEEAELSPGLMKVMWLESYEDALRNLEMRRTPEQATLLEDQAAQGSGQLREQYLLRYMLDVETRGSQSLLNVPAFHDPTAYTLNVKPPGSDERREVKIDLLETFDWLLGLKVQHIAAPQVFSAEFERESEGRLRLKGRLEQHPEGSHWFRTVEGTMPDGRKTLIIWRKLTGEPEPDNVVLAEWFAKQGYAAKGSEFDLIYVNGSNNLENLKTPDDIWKVRLIEDDFHRLMFETDGA